MFVQRSFARHLATTCALSKPKCLNLFQRAYSVSAAEQVNAVIDLKQAIKNSIKTSMKSGKKTETAVLKSVMADIIYMEKSSQANQDISASAMIRKGIKRREESAVAFRAGNREDLALIEESEIQILNSLLPKQMSEECIAKIIGEIKERIGAKGLGDLGKVMKVANTELNSSVSSMKLVSEVAKKILSA
ncbi:hypothetical protein BDEG_21586 [Batrachochytrium dendrobatidis JEL423]|nr:hypothetical protein BDEG_21586 [Batrachochytrium dendrobatidis JEL423]